MRTNSYQLQHETFTRLVDGQSTLEIWEDYKSRRESLRHLAGGGNPSHNQFKDEINAMIGTIRDQIEEANAIGPFAQRDVKLRFQATELAGRMLEALVNLEPATIQDAEDLKDCYNAVQTKITSDSLRDLDVALGDRFKDEIDALYGAVPAKE